MTLNRLTAIKQWFCKIDVLDVIGVLLIISIMGAVVAGVCVTASDLADIDLPRPYGDSFTLIEHSYKYDKVYDNATLVIYIVDKSGAFSPLVDAEGKPLLYAEEQISQ